MSRCVICGWQAEEFLANGFTPGIVQQEVQCRVHILHTCICQQHMSFFASYHEQKIQHLWCVCGVAIVMLRSRNDAPLGSFVRRFGL